MDNQQEIEDDKTPHGNKGGELTDAQIKDKEVIRKNNELIT